MSEAKRVVNVDSSTLSGMIDERRILVRGSEKVGVTRRTKHTKSLGWIHGKSRVLEFRISRSRLAVALYLLCAHSYI